MVQDHLADWETNILLLKHYPDSWMWVCSRNAKSWP